MSRIPIALQLYSVREACQEDFPGTLKAIAEMGYEGVDFAGYYGYEAREIRRMLDDLGLAVAGCHTSLDTLMGDELAKTIEFHHILGNKYLIVPSIPEEYRSSRDAWLRMADLFNEIAAKLEPEGMFTGYHNHHVEFQPYEDGMTPWDVLFSNTRPEVVMQLDVGNCLHGGGDPVSYLLRPCTSRTTPLTARMSWLVRGMSTGPRSSRLWRAREQPSGTSSSRNAIPIRHWSPCGAVCRT